MRSPYSVWRYALPLVLVACDGASYSEQPYCHTDCPLPPTQPPTVAWITPTPGSTVYPGTVVSVSAHDDKQVDHVELYYFSQRLTPSPLQAPPYAVEFGRYLDTDAMAQGPMTLRAIVTDIEGYADTAYVTANFVRGP